MVISIRMFLAVIVAVGVFALVTRVVFVSLVFGAHILYMIVI